MREGEGVGLMGWGEGGGDGLVRLKGGRGREDYLIKSQTLSKELGIILFTTNTHICYK